MNPKTSKTVEDLVEELLDIAWDDKAHHKMDDEKQVRTALSTAESRGYERGLAAAREAVPSGIDMQVGERDLDIGFRGGHNACRAAVLSALEKLSKQEEL